MSDETDDRGDEDEDDDDPRVVLGKLRALGKHCPEATAKAYGDRPIWFVLGMDAELATIFERLPEDPMPKGRAAAILGAIRSFATEENAALQEILGVTDSIEYGFHVDATLDRVREAFEEDGFFVVATIEDGEVVPVELDDEAPEESGERT